MQLDSDCSRESSFTLCCSKFLPGSLWNIGRRLSADCSIRSFDESRQQQQHSAVDSELFERQHWRATGTSGRNQPGSGHSSGNLHRVTKDAAVGGTGVSPVLPDESSSLHGRTLQQMNSRAALPGSSGPIFFYSINSCHWWSVLLIGEGSPMEKHFIGLAHF